MKDLRTLIEEYNIELKSIGKDLYRGYCIFHEDKASGKPQLTYYAATESFYCFRCGIGGDNIRFLSLAENISYAEAKIRLVGTESERFQEINEIVDNLDVNIEQSFNLKVNFVLRPKFRELFYKYPEKIEDILNYLKGFDEELQNKITVEKMDELFDSFKKFNESVVA